ncbi:MAG: extracellular solute-binding protein [Chloroflexi bacterium]|nr:extracellular solute-binding protein [Chloroflexota bacterium]
MNRLTRIFLLAATAILLSSFFGTAAAQDEEVTLDLWMFLDGTGFLPSVVEAFEAAHPNIKVRITDVPEGEYVTKVDTAFLAGQPPDIAFPYVIRWIRAGLVAPIDDVLESAGVNIEDYNAGAVSRNCALDGQVFCLGTFTAGYNIFYNKDVFDAAGAPHLSSTEPITIDEYAGLVAQLSAYSDDMSERVWGGTLPMPWWTDAANYFSEDGRSVMGYVNDEATAHFYQVVADMAGTDGILSSADLSLVGNSANDMLAAGQLAMAMADSPIAQPLLEAAGVNWGAAPPPVEAEGDPAWVYTGSDELMALSGSDNLQEALQFILFWATEGNRMRAEAGGLPMNMRMAEEMNWAEGSEGRQELLEAINLGRSTVFVPTVWGAYGEIAEAINSLMIEDGIPAQEALDEIAPIIQDDLDQLWETWDTFETE